MDTSTAQPPVILYTTPTCPDCRALKAWLRELKIHFDERDLTDAATAEKARLRTGVRVAPIAIVGDVVSYGTFGQQKQVLEQLLRVSTGD